MKTKKKANALLANKPLIEFEKLRIEAREKVRDAEDAMQAVLDYALALDAEIESMKEALRIIATSDSYRLSQSVARNALEGK